MDITAEKCRVCGGKATEQFDGTVRGKYRIKYYRCGECGFLQTQKPYWLQEAYEESINLSDTGLVRRNLWLSNVTVLIMFLLRFPKGTGLDYGGGYGLFVRLMRDKGIDFRWEDPWTKNLFARGFEYRAGDYVNLVTSFEAFEHFEKPKDEIEQMLQRGDNILFSTHLLPEPVPAPDQWWYYDLENGQHIGFYGRKTLEWIARQYGMHLSTAWSVHLLSRRRIPNLFFRAAVVAGRLGLNRALGPWLGSRTVHDMDLLRERNSLTVHKIDGINDAKND